MADFPGCCSRYVECSDALRCTNPDVEFSKICAYKKNLMNGRIFYGKNANIYSRKSIQEVQELSQENLQKDTELYLYCYGAFFAIRHRHKNGFSYSLTPEHIQKLTQLFQNKDIPFRTRYNYYDIYPEGETDMGPANSRVVITLDDKEEFHILQNNCCLIPSCYAKGIAMAFSNKNIKARIETIGTFGSSATVINFLPPKSRDEPDRLPVKNFSYEKSVATSAYKQLSIWDII
jgi:hypothetical protein